MQRFANRRRFYLLGALLASQWLTACVVLPLPYHRHRPHVVEPYYGGHNEAPRERRHYPDRRHHRSY